VALFLPRDEGKKDRNDWDTACGNFKKSISSLYQDKNCAYYFLFYFTNTVKHLFFNLNLLFGGVIYRQQVTTFSTLAGLGIDTFWQKFS
jgi:hypothetical protein